MGQPYMRVPRMAQYHWGASYGKGGSAPPIPPSFGVGLEHRMGRGAGPGETVEDESAFIGANL